MPESLSDGRVVGPPTARLLYELTSSDDDFVLDVATPVHLDDHVTLGGRAVRRVEVGEALDCAIRSAEPHLRQHPASVAALRPDDCRALLRDHVRWEEPGSEFEAETPRGRVPVTVAQLPFVDPAKDIPKG